MTSALTLCNAVAVILLALGGWLGGGLSWLFLLALFVAACSAVTIAAVVLTDPGCAMPEAPCSRCGGSGREPADVR